MIPFSQAGHPRGHAHLPPGKKTHRLRHFVLNMIILPRQARDKHRESTQKRDMRFLQLKFYGEQLGAGAQGTVRKARWKGNDYAVKMFKASDLTDFEEEVRVLEHLRHPNVVTFYGAVTRNAQHHAIVQELCLGSVYDYLQKFGRETAAGAGGTARLNLPTRIRKYYAFAIHRSK